MTAVEIMSARVLDQLREACRLAADTLLMVGDSIRPGIRSCSSRGCSLDGRAWFRWCWRR